MCSYKRLYIFETETSKMQYQLRYDLQHQAALRIATSFWEKKDVKDRVLEFFDSIENIKIDERRSSWYKLTSSVLITLDTTILPPQLRTELIHIIREVGEKIYNWYLYIEYENESKCGDKKNSLNYMKKIYWTPYGTIDEVKILKLCWLNNPNVDVTKLYNIACRYTLKECTKELWKQIPKNARARCSHHCLMCSDRHILDCWQSLKDTNLSEFRSCFETSMIDCRNDSMSSLRYDTNRTPMENLFRLTVYEGYTIAAKFFWGELTKDERKGNIIDTARITVRRYNDFEYVEEGVGYYRKEKFVDICIFLINQMTTEQKKSFYNETLMFEAFYFDARDVKGEVLRMCLSVWPWQNLIGPVLNDILIYLERDSETVNMFLNTLTWKMVEDYKLKYSVATSKYSSLLRSVWYDLPGSLKRKMGEQEVGLQFMRNLIDVWDIDNLKLILNDPEIASVRDQYIKAGREGYIQLIKNDKYELLDQFMEDLFLCEESKIHFKQKINIWDYFLKADEFHLADKLLDWQCSMREYREYLKNRIDHFALCEHFVQQEEYDLADKFLRWHFENEEEIKQCKDTFANNISTIKWVFEIWKKGRKNTTQSKEKSYQFLRWLLESEDEIVRYKSEKLVRHELDKLLIDYFIERNLTEVAEEFLYWCLLSKDEVERIKKMIGYEIGHNVCKHDIPMGYATDAEDFIKWAFSEENLRDKFIKSFIMSEEGVISCHHFIRDTSIASYNMSKLAKVARFTEFIDFWIKPVQDIYEFRNKFVSYEVSSVFLYDAAYKENLWIFIEILKNLELTLKNPNILEA